MTREEAIDILKCDISADKQGIEYCHNEVGIEALEMAIQALENIGHLKDRPCNVCEFRKENGCCKWNCVFDGHIGKKGEQE